MKNYSLAKKALLVVFISITMILTTALIPYSANDVKPFGMPARPSVKELYDGKTVTYIEAINIIITQEGHCKMMQECGSIEYANITVDDIFDETSQYYVKEINYLCNFSGDDAILTPMG